MNEFQPGEVLVRFSSTVGIQQIVLGPRSASLAIGAQTTERLASIDVDRVTLPSGLNVMDAVAYYRSQPGVEYAEPNYKRQTCFVPNDAEYANQYAPQKVHCPEAWNLSQGKASVIIAIIDTGIDPTHPDLKNKIVPGYDIGSGDSNPTSTEAHGNHTAGIAAADTNNGVGIAGAGFNCRIMPIKLAPRFDASHSASAIIYAADHGARVISMSYGSTHPSSTEQNAVNYAWNKGLVIVAAAGNNGVDAAFYPASYDNVISVASSRPDDTLSPFSNYGADRVDVAAPGENILSTVPGGYASMTGTSMSCPLVAGVVGLLWSFATPSTTNTQIRAALENNCDTFTWVRHGRINAFKALQSLDPGVEVVSHATGVAKSYGASGIGGLSDILTSDSNAFKVGSAAFPGGQLSAAEVTFAFQGSTSNLRLSQAYLDSNGPSGTSSVLFLWNFQTGQYVQIRATALRPTGQNRILVDLPLNLSPYVSGGSLKMLLRAIQPDPMGGRPKPPFTYSLNFVELHTKPGV